jgi:hypothetical protein
MNHQEGLMLEVSGDARAGILPLTLTLTLNLSLPLEPGLNDERTIASVTTTPSSEGTPRLASSLGVTWGRGAAEGLGP